MPQTFPQGFGNNLNNLAICSESAVLNNGWKLSCQKFSFKKSITRKTQSFTVRVKVVNKKAQSARFRLRAVLLTLPYLLGLHSRSEEWFPAFKAVKLPSNSQQLISEPKYTFQCNIHASDIYTVFQFSREQLFFENCQLKTDQLPQHTRFQFVSGKASKRSRGIGQVLTRDVA